MKSLLHLRLFLAVGLVFGLFEQGNAEENCEISSPQINQAIEAFNATERGAEYCAARTSVNGDLDQDGKPDLLVAFTIEGACSEPEDAQSEPGTCGNLFESYMMAFTGSQQSASEPILIGGKGIQLIEELTIANAIIQVDSLKYAESDAMCCPTVATRDFYRLEGRKLVAVQKSSPPVAPPSPAQPAPATVGSITVDGTVVAYQPVPEVKAGTVAFQMESKGYRNIYLLDCLERKYIWAKNIDLRTNQATDNNAGAEWKMMSEKSTVTNAVYDAICPQLLGSNSAVTQSNCIRTESYIPDGWCQPGPADMVDEWLVNQAEVPEPYHITGWFDENSTKDHAWILYRQDRSKWGIFAFLIQGQSYIPIKLRESAIEDGIRIQNFHLSLANPGEIETACGKGYWDCEPGEPAKILLKTNGIIAGPFDSGGAVLNYYQSGKFEGVVLDD